MADVTALRTIHRLNACRFADGQLGSVNGMHPDGTVDETSEQSSEAWVGTTYALAAFMLGRGLTQAGWETARGAAAVTYERGLWFRHPRRTTRTATTAPASTCGRSRSGRSRKRWSVVRTARADAGARDQAETGAAGDGATGDGASSRTRCTNRPIRRNASSSCSYDVA